MPSASLPSLWLPDPLTAVYRRVRTGMCACPAFLQAIDSNPNNFIDGSAETFTHFDEQLKDSDLPEVAMIQTARRMKPFGPNSMTASIEQSLDIISTVRRMNVLDVNQVNWWTFVALYGLGTDLGLPGLVRDWNVTDAADSAFGQKEWKRGTLRYSSLLRITVSLSVPRQLLNALIAAA